MYARVSERIEATTSTGSAGTRSASASQPEKAASRAMAAIAPDHRRTSSGVTSDVNSTRRAKDPESVPCSSAMNWASDRPNRYGSCRPYETLSTQVQARPARRTSTSRSASSRDLPIPASPATTAIPPIRSASRRPTSPSRASRSPTRPMNRPLGGCHGWNPVSPSSRPSRTGRRWPRRTRSPRSSIVSRLRVARRVGSSRRISPGSASPWIRAAVVIAGPVSDQSMSPGTSRGAATTSPVASPIRTWSASARDPRGGRAGRGSRGRSGWRGGRRRRGRSASRTRRRRRRR